MAHRKWKDTKQLPSMLPGPAVTGCCLVFSISCGPSRHPMYVRRLYRFPSKWMNESLVEFKFFSGHKWRINSHLQGRAKEKYPCLKIPAPVLPGNLASPCTANQPISESLSSILWTLHHFFYSTLYMDTEIFVSKEFSESEAARAWFTHPKFSIAKYCDLHVGWVPQNNAMGPRLRDLASWPALAVGRVHATKADLCDSVCDPRRMKCEFLIQTGRHGTEQWACH